MLGEVVDPLGLGRRHPTHPCEAGYGGTSGYSWKAIPWLKYEAYGSQT